MSASFQSTPPSREATTQPAFRYPRLKRFNPRPPHGRRHSSCDQRAGGGGVSIHAPLTGGDIKGRLCMARKKVFQSTPPSREATRLDTGSLWWRQFQSTPPSREATPCTLHCVRIEMFQSTPPSREATRVLDVVASWSLVSIHAPLTGGDVNDLCTLMTEGSFNPRPPHGRRRSSRSRMRAASNKFQSTPPSREATSRTSRSVIPPKVSIHAPLTGGDSEEESIVMARSRFNPRPPHGRRPQYLVVKNCTNPRCCTLSPAHWYSI